MTVKTSPEPAESKTLTGIILLSKATPAIPLELLPIAEITPAIIVPWLIPSLVKYHSLKSGRGLLSPATKSQPLTSST